jgi:uncharacterized protein involved in response to NO
MAAMKRVLDAPHRIFFFAAGVQILLVSAWWAATLFARAGGAAFVLPSGLEPARVHAFVMTYGFFPLFIFGFLFTAGPRWLEQPPPPRGQYALPALIAAFSAWLTLPALVIHPAFAAGVMLVLLAVWGWILGSFLMLIATSRVRDRMHAILAACAIGVGVIGLAAARRWLATGSDGDANAMEVIGLWGFLVPLFATVCHRMIPFFTANVVPRLVPWRPAWTLVALAGGAMAHGALLLADLARWTWIVDAPVGAMALFAAWRWGAARSLGNRMLAMLHVGFVWLGIAWLLQAAASALLAAGLAPLGLAPTHALAIGFLSTLTFAMVSRVSAGHSGRSIAADTVTWIAFLTLQAAALARVAADLWVGAYSALLVVAAALWLACFAAWTWRYLPYYWRPRADGKPG